MYQFKGDFDVQAGYELLKLPVHDRVKRNCQGSISSNEIGQDANNNNEPFALTITILSIVTVGG